ncbi:hypothetical protein JL722_8230 [Aureococcus anophagefferens]|nr:hypothetical protein JL722_8230 [Aureococcus anophagefferens]
MSAGLDSLRAADLARSVGAAVSTEVPSTLVFDYPSASAIATAFAAAPDRAEKAIPRRAVVAVGGVAAGVTASFAAAGMLSPRGRCHTFDGRADGYARGEGALGTVLAAYADGVAVAASAVQHDGASASLTAPNGSSQRRLIAAVAPSDDGALEAHGTGTALGDPSRSPRRRGAAAARESAKANLGHLEAVAAFSGLAALVVAGCLADAAPNAALRRLNAHLSPTLRARGRAMVALTPRTSAAARGRLSSFGYSGTIAHAAFAHDHGTAAARAGRARARASTAGPSLDRPPASAASRRGAGAAGGGWVTMVVAASTARGGRRRVVRRAARRAAPRFGWRDVAALAAGSSSRRRASTRASRRAASRGSTSHRGTRAASSSLDRGPRPDAPRAAAPRRPAASRGAVAACAFELLGTRVASSAPLMDAGVDSTVAPQLAAALRKNFDVEVGATLVFDHPTLDAIADLLGGADAAAPASTRVASPEPSAAPFALFSRAALVPGGAALATCAASTIPPARWVAARRDAAAYGALLDAFARVACDRGASGVSRGEARAMDPQQALLLDVATRQRPPGAAGVFVGVEAGGFAAVGAYATSGHAASVAAGRLSHALALSGPCASIDAACASSLVALVVAAAMGPPVALVAGVKALSEAASAATAAAGMTSPRGRCHAFDARADGYVRGEGCVALLARRGAGTAAILAAACRHDGRSASLTAPNGSSQRRLLVAAAARGPRPRSRPTARHGPRRPVEVAAARRWSSAPRRRPRRRAATARPPRRPSASTRSSARSEPARRRDRRPRRAAAFKATPAALARRPTPALRKPTPPSLPRPRRAAPHAVAARTPTQAGQPAASIDDAIAAAVVDFLGTACDADAPLAAAGLDSVGAGEFAAALGAALRMDLPSTTLFDHPTAAAVPRLAASAAAAAAPGAGAVAEEPARAVGSAREETADVALVPARSLHLPGSSSTASELPRLCATASVACSRAPATRLTSTTPAETYGAFTGLMPSAAAAFGISKAEARSLDPRADLILRSAAATLRPVANAPVGFFLGCGALMNDAVGTVARARAPPSVYEGTSNTLSVASGRVSYALGLTGPCASLDTACSSSLVAAHAAVSALRLGECPRAVATGVGLLSASATAAFSAAGMLSALGRCHTLDRRADGYCRGEGCGSFQVTTGAGSARVDGIAVQQDGPSASLTAPNGTSQQRLLVAISWASARAVALEAHGTGTALGDPIEIGAAARRCARPADRGALRSSRTRAISRRRRQQRAWPLSSPCRPPSFLQTPSCGA